MFLCMVWVEPEPVSAPALNKSAALPAVSSLSEVLSSFSSVVITGGSSGIGKSFIELCAKLNPELVVCNLSRRTPLINNDKLKLRHFPCDLAQCGEISRVITEVENFLRREVPTGRVLLINNSGFGTFGRFPEPNLARTLEMIDVNVRAVVDVTGKLLPFIKTRGGVIMTIASTAAFQPTAFTATYGATKAFVLHWSLALNEELRGTGVRTLAVCPGTTATDFFQRAGVQPRAARSRLQTSDAVVRTALKALANGRTQAVSGGFNRLLVAIVTKLPKPLAARLAGNVLKRYYQKQDPHE
jgi:short-subunit dehydrogenase